MKQIDIAVIGSGIGGSLISALNGKKRLIMFEKSNNLGGCASTFRKKGAYFNAGATTMTGLDSGHTLDNIFKAISFKPDVLKSDVAFRVIQKNRAIDRTTDFEQFIADIDKLYPNKNNRIFWSKIKEIDEKFWAIKNIYFAKYSLKGYLKTVLFAIKMFMKFRFSLLVSANSFISQTLGEIDDAYRDFIDAGLLITLQKKSDNLSLLQMSLGLSYPFHDVYYANGGMGAVIDGIAKGVVTHKNEAITKIEQSGDKFILHSSKNRYLASKVILNTTLYDSGSLFVDTRIKSYYNSFAMSDQSAFVVYLKIKSKQDFLHHYQIILDEELPNSISKSFFVSFSDSGDEIMSKDGYSLTISTHTKAIFWKDISKIEYSKRKNELQEFIINEFLKHFDTIKKDEITELFSATASTFNSFIARQNCGGLTMSIKDILQTPSCNTPFKNLYNVGDTVFAGQGWGGVAIGVDILQGELNG